jgi:H/ACA ribonucleoprotein complex subunit 3
MPRLLHKCQNCNNYTMNSDSCPTCGGPVVAAHPARFSIEDRYGKYRREMKKLLLTQQHSPNETENNS